MKCVILAGGKGSRISEESVSRPKPMIEIGGKPILWHIMKTYSYYGINEFIICLGYKGYFIKEYFANYFLHLSDVTFDLEKNHMEVHQNYSEPWKVTLVDTGLDAGTGGRLKKVENHIDGEDFCMTYGDGVSDINIGKLIQFHKDHGKEATLTAVLTPGRFGILDLKGSHVTSFSEKPTGDGSFINGGFFVLKKKVLSYIEHESTFWERGPLEYLANINQLEAYQHDGFWQPMDTLRDKKLLESLWDSGKPPWKVWT